MARKNRNSVKGKNSGRKFDGREMFEEIDGAGLLAVVNSNTKILAGLDKRARA